MIGNLEENSDTGGMPAPFIGVSVSRSRRYRLSLRPITIKADSHVFQRWMDRRLVRNRSDSGFRTCSSQESYE